MAEIPTKPYLIRALYEWCTDNGYRPYIAVAVDERTQVPREFVRNGEIVLNISAAATNRLSLGNELVEFEARFGGVARHVSIPIENISAIFAQENGHGMAFEVPKAPAVPPQATGAEAGASDQGAGAPAEGGAPGAGTDAASLPTEDEAAGDAGPVPASGRARKRPKLAAVPGGEPAPRPGRRKATIAALPAAAKDRDGARRGKPATTTPDAPGGESGDDDPGPGTAPPGRPRLTRVK